MKTAFTYHRYSTDNQRDGYSLEVQRNITKKLAEKYECNISAVFEDEGISGATVEKRPQMLALLEEIKTIKPDYLICVDQDRISRGNEFWYIKSLMSKYNVSLITDKEGIINFKEDISMDFMSDIIASAAKYERGMIKQRIKRAISERANNGNFVGNLTNIHGYDHKDGNLVINEEGALLVKRIFEMSANGQGYTGISRQLNREGIISKNNGNYTVERIRYILSNPLYCGYIKHGDQILKGNHEPIIDEFTFKKVQISIARNQRILKTRPAKYLLTGFLKCGHCGASLGGNYKTNNGHGSPTTIYRCNGHIRGLCENPVYLNLDKIESYIIEKIKKKIADLQLDINSGVIKIKQDIPLESLEVEKKRTSLQKKLDKLLVEYTEGFLDKGRYRAHIHNINMQLAGLKVKKQGNLDWIVLKDIDPLKVFEDADFEDKRRIITLVVDKIMVSRMDKSFSICKRIGISWNVFK